MFGFIDREKCGGVESSCFDGGTVTGVPHISSISRLEAELQDLIHLNEVIRGYVRSNSGEMHSGDIHTVFNALPNIDAPTPYIPYATLAIQGPEDVYFPNAR